MPCRHWQWCKPTDCAPLPFGLHLQVLLGSKGWSHDGGGNRDSEYCHGHQEFAGEYFTCSNRCLRNTHLAPGESLDSSALGRPPAIIKLCKDQNAVLAKQGLHHLVTVPHLMSLGGSSRCFVRRSREASSNTKQKRRRMSLESSSGATHKSCGSSQRFPPRSESAVSELKSLYHIRIARVGHHDVSSRTNTCGFPSFMLEACLHIGGWVMMPRTAWAVACTARR